MSAIPTRYRDVVRLRFQRRCARCGMHAVAGAVHHRRSRAVIDPHTHCPCNLVWLCTTCHAWAHAQPTLAVTTGFIVSRYTAEPTLVPLTTAWGQRTLTCV